MSIGHRHQPLKSSQLPIPLRHVAIRWRHQPINCPHRTIRFRHLSREWLHSGLKISTVTAGDSRPRFCLSTAPAAHVPGQPHISLRNFRLGAANRTLHKGDEDTDLLQPSKRRRAALHRRRKRSRCRWPRSAGRRGAFPWRESQLPAGCVDRGSQDVAVHFGRQALGVEVVDHGKAGASVARDEQQVRVGLQHTE